MSKYGIDVSEHNGNIDWNTARKSIEFCFLRGGYGKNNIDKKFIYNAKQCIKYGIPFGIYWFSYALTEDEAKREADYACSLADDYTPDLPICYDWEYDSDSNAIKKGYKITNSDREKFAIAFLERVKQRGYSPVLYTNPDYIHNKGFIRLINRYPLLLAQWGSNKPSIRCHYWQCSSQGKVNGISTNVDIDVCLEDNITTEVDFTDALKFAEDRYKQVAYDIIDGKYGVGNTRKNKLKEAGYDYDLAQKFVNRILEIWYA